LLPVPYFIDLRLTYSDLKICHLTSHHFTSPHLTSPHIKSGCWLISNIIYFISLLLYFLPSFLFLFVCLFFLSILSGSSRLLVNWINSKEVLCPVSRLFHVIRPHHVVPRKFNVISEQRQGSYGLKRKFPSSEKYLLLVQHFFLFCTNVSQIFHMYSN
jgi:hypothetical protein